MSDYWLYWCGKARDVLILRAGAVGAWEIILLNGLERDMRKYAVAAALVGVLALASTGVAGQAAAAMAGVAGKDVVCSNQGGAQRHKVHCVNVSPSVNVDIDVSRMLNVNEINILVIELNKLDLDIDAKLLVVQIERTVIAILSKFDIVVGPGQIKTCVERFCG